MIENFQDLLECIQSARRSSDIEGYDKISYILVNCRSRIEEMSISRGVVGDLLPTLKVRLWNSLRIQKKIYGLAALIDVLEQFSEDARIVGYGVVTPNAVGTIYLAEESMKALGFVLVDI